MSDDFFAPPPFKPEAALTGFKRDLRALGLAEREGRFEVRGLAVLELEIATAGDAIEVKLAKRPARTPEWTRSRARSSADMRRLHDTLKAALAGWNDRDD